MVITVWLPKQDVHNDGTSSHANVAGDKFHWALDEELQSVNDGRESENDVSPTTALGWIFSLKRLSLNT